MKQPVLAALAAAFLAVTPAVSAEYTGPGHVLDPVLVTARGYAASESDTPGSVGVVNEQDIAVSPRGSLVDSLERLPGITRTGESPWAQDISIRGFSGPSVVILVNGKRINTATDMNARLGFIDPADVERIEVLKGPVSALYGSGSIGGVVNIITRKADFSDGLEAHGRLSASGSTNPGGGSGYLSFALSGERAWAFISGAMRDYGDTFGGRDSLVRNSSFMDKQGRAALGFRPWDPLTVTIEAIHSIGNDIGIPGGVSSMPQLARVGYKYTDFSLFSVDATVDVDGEYCKTVEAGFYYTQNKRRVRIDQIPPAANGGYPVELLPRSEHETWGGKLQSTVEAGDHTVVAGADFWTWTIDSNRWRHMYRPPAAGGPIMFEDKPVPDATQVSVGVFIEDDWKLSPFLTLNLGGRLDWLNTDSDPMFNVSPVAGSSIPGRTELYGSRNETDLGWHLHAGLTWQVNEAWSQSLLLASSYRAADLLERFKYLTLGSGVTVYGNPELDPEQSIYAEYGLRYDASPVMADLRLFANVVTNYIAEKQISATERRLDNVDDAKIYGAELEARYQFHPEWSLFGNVSGLYGRDGQNRQALPGVAPLSGAVGVDYRNRSGFWARMDSRMIAPQRSVPEGADNTPGVILLNASAGYSFTTERLTHHLTIAVDNILDSRYRNYLANQRGYTIWEPGISAMASYTVEF